ncbi:MAG TPA: M48 family metalloprotease [Gemmataceae bacterium]|nr:M48 family metalloprotease [Gemmataceae bacterium]
MRSLYRQLIGFYVPFLLLYWVVLVGLAPLLVWFLRGNILAIGLLLVLPAMAFLQSLWTCRLLLQHDGDEDDPLELRLSREMLAELYELVEKVASARESPAPHLVRLEVDANAGAYEERNGRRVLVLGCPLLMLLSENALSGVIAHELGHFAAGDTRRSRLDRGRVSMMALLEGRFAEGRLLRWNPVTWALRGYHWLCFRAWAADPREREFRADRHEVRQVGKKQAAATLIFLQVPTRLPYARLESVAETAAETGQPLEDLFAEQRQRLKSISPREWEEALQKELKRKTEALDTHPCLRERLKAVGVSPKKALALALEQSGPPIADRLEAWPAIEKVLSRRVVAWFRAYHLAKMERAEILLGGSFRR